MKIKDVETIFGGKAWKNGAGLSQSESIDDPALPRLGDLLDKEKALELFRQNLRLDDGKRQYEIEDSRIVYTRHGAGRSCNLMYALALRSSEGDSGEYLLSCKILPDNAALDYRKHREAKLNQKSILSPTVLRMPEYGLVANLFPNDLGVKGLSGLFRTSRLKASLCEALGTDQVEFSSKAFSGDDATIYSYKPERSCLIGCKIQAQDGNSEREEKTIFVRVYRGNKGRDIEHAMRLLWRSEERRASGLRVAEPLGYAEKNHVLVQSKLDGEPMNKLLDTERFRQAVVESAEALAKLHRLDGQLTRSRHASASLDYRHRSLDGYPPSMSWFAAPANRIAERLQDLRPRANGRDACIIHGDMGRGQILVEKDHISIIDFEQACMGDPYEDLACFAGRLSNATPSNGRKEEIVQAMRADFFDAYVEASGKPLDKDAMVWHEGLAHLRGALSAATQFRPGWRKLAERHLRQAKDIVG